MYPEPCQGYAEIAYKAFDIAFCRVRQGLNAQDS